MLFILRETENWNTLTYYVIMHRHKKIVKLYYKKVYRHPDWYAFLSIKQIQLHNTTMIYVKKEGTFLI